MEENLENSPIATSDAPPRIRQNDPTSASGMAEVEVNGVTISKANKDELLRLNINPDLIPVPVLQALAQAGADGRLIEDPSALTGGMVSLDALIDALHLSDDEIVDNSHKIQLSMDVHKETGRSPKDIDITLEREKHQDAGSNFIGNDGANSLPDDLVDKARIYENQLTLKKHDLN